ncbi:SAM-dependent chlorinase/fluorinase [Candidatus Binatia bacterium]|nr:SAM-dependent chlorinase/fluorinase [Candidatus Binatia bacterium]
MRPSGIVTLLTDFGTADAYVGVMKGVMLGIDRGLRIVDLTHAVPPQAVRVGALLLRQAVTHFPAGTVHLAVVDPGVGSARRPVLAVCDTGYLVGPDNGLLAPAAAVLGVREVRALENPRYFRAPVSRTFHGRDIFAPVAAHLAFGTPPEACGPPLTALAPLSLPEPAVTAGGIAGEVLYVDRFGNLITNIDAGLLARFRGGTLSVTICQTLVAGPVAAYAAVPGATPLAIVGSWGTLEIAVRDGNAADYFAAAAGTPVTVAWEPGNE